MKRKYHEARSHFVDHFHYYPGIPLEVDFDLDKYVDLLEKSVNEDHDYTSDLYGTHPAPFEPYDPNALIID